MCCAYGVVVATDRSRCSQVDGSDWDGESAGEIDPVFPRVGVGVCIVDYD